MFDVKVAAGIKSEFEVEIAAVLAVEGFEAMGKVEKGILFTDGVNFVVVSAVVKKDEFDATEALAKEVAAEIKREAVKEAKLEKLAKVAKDKAAKEAKEVK